MSDNGPFAGTKVMVGNWDQAPKPAQPIYAKKTTLKTWVLDSTGAVGPKQLQICDYEPNRTRLSVIVYDRDVAITNDAPMTSPDNDAAGLAPQGALLGGGTTYWRPYDFFGPDAFWINTLGPGTARIVVIKEYC